MKKLLHIFIVVLFVMTTIPTVSFAQEATIHKEIIYDILVDRFNNGNHAFSEQVRIDDPYAYHGGDLEGILLKLDDLKEQGFTTISLSSIMDNATDGYHGYWIEDFYTVEEQFGTLEDLTLLVEEAHKRDMKVMLELVTNYVANTHPIVTDVEKENWILSNVELDTTNESWLSNVSVLNQDNPEVQEMLMDVALHWLEETDVDGFILHAADQGSMEFVDTLTTELKEFKPELMIIAEVLSDQMPKELLELSAIDAVDNPELSQAIVDAFANADNPIISIYEKWEETKSNKNLIYVDNRWMDRFTQIVSENKRDDVNTWNLALTYLFTTPGVPIIFQGSEIPMYGSGVEQTQQLVNFNSGDQELEEVYSKILALRKQFPVLQYGDFELVETDQGMSVFKRSYQGETMYIAINNDSESRRVTITDIEEGIQLRGVLGDDLVRDQGNGEYKIALPREAADVYIMEEDSGINWAFVAPIVIILLLFVSAVVYLSKKQKKRDQTN
ncbi:alpha-amylase family glycosyl hydrolase [Ornithinibacillus halotolerans]|uniref:Glycosyl hydrolase family 13 catalytic domain-containing protein n=1 Tax=Ornithinibacillus halotolerans TaxID=1274357 RepID=A0A916W7D3_9BACI|nr:alpha-amylase family glycosyl hydrolase [Ornithinibacillus halotolerans]GGA73802.1 hypothetical protein GCM10008025_16870 [Ornithinibacillus halotolerans]